MSPFSGAVPALSVVGPVHAGTRGGERRMLFETHSHIQLSNSGL